VENLHLQTKKWISISINIRGQFHQHFYIGRSQKRKMTDGLTAFFTLLGSARVKAARRTLVKLTPDIACSLVSKKCLNIGS